jgi:hypothetical protein
MSAKPPNHGTYQIWHKGRTHAADVESVAVHKVYELTRRRPELWKHKPGVTLHTDHPRTTRNGDVIVDPTCGAWKVERDGFLAVAPPAPVKERMEREGIVPQHLQLLKEWTTHMLDVAGKDDVSIAPAPGPPLPASAVRDERDGLPTPEEWRQLKAEWTMDYGLRRMEDRGVSYEDQADRPLDRTQDRTAPRTAAPDPAQRAKFQKRDTDRGHER